MAEDTIIYATVRWTSYYLFCKLFTVCTNLLSTNRSLADTKKKPKSHSVCVNGTINYSASGPLKRPRLPNLEVVVVGSRKLDGGWRGGSKRDIGGRSVGERRNVTINLFGWRGYRTRSDEGSTAKLPPLLTSDSDARPIQEGYACN
jgi:hypothetical protein